MFHNPAQEEIKKSASSLPISYARLPRNMACYEVFLFLLLLIKKDVWILEGNVGYFLCWGGQNGTPEMGQYEMYIDGHKSRVVLRSYWRQAVS